MYPFLVLDLPHDTSDQQTAERYQQLVSQYPPDRAPETFVAIRQAYEAIKDERARLQTRLFDFDAKGGSLRQNVLPLVSTETRRRLSAAELSELLRRVNLDEIAR
jgi:DnaJ-class molecular chaperone